MHVVTGKHLREAAERFPVAAKQIAAWRAIVKDAQWRSPGEIKDNFGDVDCAGDRAVFRIHGTRYRLVATVHYSREQNGRLCEGHVWVRSFLTSREYENATHRDKGAMQ